VRPLKDRRDFNLISDALSFGRLWYGEPDAIDNAISYTKRRSRSHHKLIRVYHAAGNVIERHEDAGDFKEPAGQPRIPYNEAVEEALRFGWITRAIQEH
jgi:hypothetical protein